MRVLRELRPDQGLHRHRDFFRGQESAIAHHRAAHVEQHHGGATGGAFVQMEFEIAFVEFDLAELCAPADSLSLRQAVARQRVVQRLVQVELADRVAELVRLGAFDALAAGAGGDFFVAVALALAEVGEDFHQGLLLHFLDGPRRQAELALAVLVEHAFFEQLLEQVGLLLVFRVLHHLLDGLHAPGRRTP